MLTVSDNHIVLGGGGGGGDVVGAASSTDNAIARWDGVTGKLLQNSRLRVNDDGSAVLSGTSATTLMIETSAPLSTFRGFSMGYLGNEYSSYKQRIDTGEVVLAAGFSGWGGSVTIRTSGTNKLVCSPTGIALIVDGAGSSGVDGQVLKKVGGLVLWANQ